MAHAIFLRAANVGGHNVFSPKQFAQDHPELRLTNIGHAGTFVTTVDLSAADLQAAMADALPVPADMAIVAQADVQAMLHDAPAVDGAKLEATVLFDDVPDPGSMQWPEPDWEVRLERIDGRLAITNRKPGGRLSPCKLLEQHLGVAGTTRSWNVMAKVATIG